VSDTVSAPAFIEGDLVRSTNELYVPFGIGRIQKVKGPQAKVEFNPSVFMQPPYRSENKILQLGEVQRIDTPLERASRGQWDDPRRFELRVLAARFLTGNVGGQLSNARTEILPHQIFAAHRVVSAERRRFLLADEVGLGKTIEAGMIWQALTQRGQARRTLIITPAGLTTQWQEEMQDKFRATFEIFGRDFRAVNPRIWDLKAAAIASIDTLKRAEHKRILLENRRWDLIIFDEAHRLSATDYGGSGKIERTQNYRLAEEVRDRQYCDAFLLLTATPHQGDENHQRFIHLLRLLDDNIDFSSLEEVPLFAGSGRKFTDLVIRTPKKAVTDAHGHVVFRGRQTHRMPFKMYADEAKFYKAVEQYIQRGYRSLDRLNDPTQKRAAGFLLTTFQKLNASSTAAIESSLRSRLLKLKGELAELQEEEADEDGEFADERYEGEHEERDAWQSDAEIVENEIDTLQSLLDMRIKRDRKLDELLKLIDHIAGESAKGEREKVLIFTEYRKTQEHLVAELEKCYGRGCCVVIHGGMKLERQGEAQESIDSIWAPFHKDGALVAPTTKRTSQRLFRDHEKVRFLVSTEAGGEGINLQFCHICINYDIPWNPMRVEQRVGRVYRFGQTKVVQVYHFLNEGTIEDKVQSYFESRLDRAAAALSKITGENAEEIKATLYGQLESELDPKDVYKKAMVEGNLNKQTQQDIEKAVERAKQAYEIATRSLFRDVSSYSFDSYSKELASDLTLNDLARFTERFLALHRRQLQRKGDFLEFLLPEALKRQGLPERIGQATFSRELAIARTDAEFLALGHPVIDAMLEYVGSYDFGGLASRRAVACERLRGKAGYLFVFVIRQRITREDGDECLFHFEPVFVGDDGQIDCDAAIEAVAGIADGDRAGDALHTPNAAFQTARECLESQQRFFDWDDDVEFVGLSRVEFV
jgi:SNF2 family DNA or RNA helicase